MAIQKKRPLHKVDCYLKWLHLKVSKEYREASQEILRLQNAVVEADERFRAAYAAYLPYLEPRVPDSPEKQIGQKEYWEAEKSARQAQEALTAIEDETCRKFGIVQWWNPDDDSITIADADCLFSAPALVEVLDPGRDKMIDLHAEARRALWNPKELEKTWSEPPLWKTKLDKEGCLLLKVYLNAPLEEIERAIGRLLRFYRDKPKTRNRPDTRQKGIEVFLAWKKDHDLGTVAQTLQLSLTTTRRLFRETFRKVYGDRPPRKQKARKAADFVDIPSHVSDCARCQNGARTGKWGDFCDIAKAAIDQDSNWGWILSGQL